MRTNVLWPAGALAVAGDIAGLAGVVLLSAALTAATLSRARLSTG
jgi:hypothetical protein